MRTPLFDQHLATGGRMVEFAGWEMPVQYTGILQEHKAVREACGVFDISHMGEFFVSGTGATAWLDGLLTNNLAALPFGHAQYTILLNERGGVIDDLIAYRLGEENYLLIVNAAKIPEDAAWLRKHAAPGV
jgi:aminomethyltransferase